MCQLVVHAHGYETSPEPAEFTSTEVVLHCGCTIGTLVHRLLDSAFSFFHSVKHIGTFNPLIDQGGGTLLIKSFYSFVVGKKLFVCVLQQWYCVIIRHLDIAVRRCKISISSCMIN